MTLEHNPVNSESPARNKREVEVLRARGRRGARIRYSKKNVNEWNKFFGPEEGSFDTTLRVEREE